jgi:hypothetical protein
MTSARAYAILLGLLALTAARVDAGVLVSVDTNTPSISADGKSYAQILVTVLEQTGASVSDGTEVRLTTSAGDITPAVYTAGGRAVGILTSSTCPQIATINAIVNGISGSTQVEYLVSSGEEEAAAGARTIRMTGGSLAYSVEQDVIIGSNSVTMEYKGITIRAASIQVNQSSGQIRAQGEVSVRKGDKTLTANELACDMRGERIHMLCSDDRNDAKAFDVGKLEPADAESAKNDAIGFNPLLNINGRTWVVSRRLVLIPSQKILFYKASIYVGESKVVSMPYYSYSYKDRQSILQQVHYTSNDGMLVNLPFYYRLTESGASSVKLRYAASGSEIGGYSRPRKGPSIGLEHDYLVGDAGRGMLFVDSLGSSSQAYELAHHLEYGSALDSGRADISARYQPSSSYAKGIYSTSVNVSGSLPSYSYSVLGYYGGSRIKRSFGPGGYLDQSNCSLRTVIRSKKAIASSLVGNMIPSLTVGYGMPSGSLSSCLYQSLGLNSNRTRPINSHISSGLDGAVGFTMTAEGDTGAEMRLRPSIRTHWVGGNASINYTLNLKSGLNNSVWAQGKHQIGTSLFFDIGNKLSCSSYVDFGLDSKRMNLYSTLRYRATKHWQVRSSYDLYRYSYQMNAGSYTYTTSYLQAGLYRPVGMYEIGLVWSPDGQLYGMNQGKRLWLELSGLGF